MHFATYDKVHALTTARNKKSFNFIPMQFYSFQFRSSLLGGRDAIKKDMIPGCQTFLKGLKVKGQKSEMEIWCSDQLCLTKTPS